MKSISALTLMLSCSLCGCDAGTVTGTITALALGLLGMGGQSEETQTGTQVVQTGTSLGLWWILGVAVAIIFVLSGTKEDRKR